VKALRFTPIVAAVALVLAACGNTTTPSATMAVTTVSSTATAQPPHSQLVDVVLPPGSTCDCSDGIESWKVPSDPNSGILTNLRAQLPLNKPYDGLPWCGEEVNPATDTTSWKWDDGGKRISVMVQTDGYISIQRMPDDPVGKGC
jgi:hypothetical protein